MREMRVSKGKNTFIIVRNNHTIEKIFCISL